MDRAFPPRTKHSTFTTIQEVGGPHELRTLKQDFIEDDLQPSVLDMSSVDLSTPPASDAEKIIDKAPSPRKKNPFAGKSKRFWVAYFMLVLTAFISALDAVIIAAALPAITSELGGTSNQAFWSGTAFLLASTITQPLYGTFSEIFGRRSNLIISLSWFLIGSILCARSGSMEMFIGSRVVCQPSIQLMSDPRNWRWRNDGIGRSNCH
jgi:hypothetical protein